ncbi:MAG: hypothetical protein J0L55_08535 [Caulobacterales bacterium]|nr:hypothetical protein [Caulobacterales bacterium]
MFALCFKKSLKLCFRLFCFIKVFTWFYFSIAIFSIAILYYNNNNSKTISIHLIGEIKMADATAILNQISGGLDGLANAIFTIHPNNNQSFTELWGWNLPGLSLTDVSDEVLACKSLCQRSLENPDIPQEKLDRLLQYPQRISFIQTQTVPNLPGGNALAAYTAIKGLIDSLETILKSIIIEPPFEVKAIEDKKLLPASQLKELKQIELGIKKLKTDSEGLNKKVDEIFEAHSIAQSLPADLQTLQEAKLAYEESVKNMERTSLRIENIIKNSNDALESLNNSKKEAAEIVNKASQAYGVTTNIGLGRAFSDSAEKLTKSVYFLGILLVIALVAAGYITYIRVEWVHKLIDNQKTTTSLLLVNATFTALSVGAPVWMAWLLTRQIGQRFKLAQDYAYKATIAKAYEGYRLEASNIDESLSRKLFEIALDKLAEGPIRLIENDKNLGSPTETEGSLNSITPKINLSLGGEKN